MRQCHDRAGIARRGFIGGVGLRNIILPELDMVIIMTTNRAEAAAAFGENWQQAGITHDVMRAARCTSGTPTARHDAVR